MATTYELINSNVLSSSAASITFSSIPATYSDLVLQVSGRTNNASASDGLTLKINGTTSNYYSNTKLRGNGADATSTQFSNEADFPTAPNGTVGDTATSNTFGTIEIYIPAYLASQNKPIGYFGAGENNSSTAFMGATAALWRQTSAITELALTPTNGSNWLSGSSFWLYGIKNS